MHSLIKHSATYKRSECSLSMSRSERASRRLADSLLVSVASRLAKFWSDYK